MKTIKMPVLDRNTKTITATREFLIRAGQFGSTEFNILLDMQRSNPGYTVKEHKISRNPDKHTHSDLTYENMSDFIKGLFPDEAEQKKALDEYEIIKQTAKVMRGSYARVKSWFLEKYKAEFNAYQEELKQKKLATKAPYIPTTTAN